jgi:hypothetical protein
MPTISELPAATTVNADDTVPVSQGGVARSATVGSLLAPMQPAILVASPSLLGRISIGPGGPEPVGVGIGLMWNTGTLIANGADHALFSVEASLQSGDQLVINSSGTAKLLQATALRSIFSAGANIAIDASGVISSTGSANNSGSNGTPYSLGALPTTTAIQAQDLVGVSQNGVDHAIPYSDLLNGQTIGSAQAAGAAADTDTFWVAQETDTMVRQTLGALWQWISANEPSIKRSVLELSASVALDPAVHNGRILLCSQPVTLTVTAATLGSGFWCEIINISSGSVAFSGAVTTSSGASTIAAGQAALLRGLSYTGGTILYAMITGATVAVAVPGAATGLSATSLGTTSIGLSWQPPIAGGAASSYTVQYRITGSGSWSQAVQGNVANSFTVTGLSPNVSYDFSVIATNLAGAGPPSGTFTASTTALLAPPGQVIGLNVSVSSSSSASLTWSAPVSGGPVSNYVVQYRTSGTTGWPNTTGALTGTSQVISGLAAATGYDFSVFAANPAGNGPTSSIVTAVTTAKGGAVTAITWNVPPSGSYAHGSGSIGVNAHVTPSSAAQFGFSTSPTAAPTTWTAAVNVNTDLWGAYVPTPPSAGTWYAWAEGTDGSCPTVYQAPFTVT